MESPQRDPTTPGVARMRLPACAYPSARVCVPARQRCVPARPHTPACLGRQEDRKTGRTARHTEQDRQHAGSSSPALPHAPCLKHLPRPPAYPALPRSPHRRMCHIVNESATRASHKMAFCQALLPFSDLPKRYTLIFNHLSPH